MGVLAVSIAVALAQAGDRRVLLPMDFGGVRVTGGMFRKQMEETAEEYLRVPNDDLLLGFRRRAGKPSPGHELGGWYSNDVFHVFGQILSGLSRLYAASGNEACKDKAIALYEGWRDCIAADGYFYASDKSNAPHYIYDKMVGGLVDMALYIGRRDALDSLAKITDWAEKHLDRSNAYAFNFISGPTEWYTLTENLYRASLVSGDKRYQEFGKVWEYSDYWMTYAKGLSIFDERPGGGKTLAYHAYSHVNNLGGAAMAYRLTGEKHYLDTVTNAYDFLMKNEVFATGGFGPNESLVPKERVLELLRETTNTFETQCGSWAVFKLCKHLISLTGEARYGDWAEQLAYNGIGATIPMSPTGQVFYYSDYSPYGAVKRNCPDGWSCCTGTRPMAVADVADLAYFRSKDGIDVNLFVPSTVEFKVGGSTVSLEQQTRFPDLSATTCVLRMANETRFALRIRKPGWLSARATAEVNGTAVALETDDKGWLVLDRPWKDGDRVEVQLPREPKAVPFVPGGPWAVAVGPVVLAFRSDNGNPASKLDAAKLATDLVPIRDEPLTYRLKADANVLARPYYAVKAGEEVFVYLDPTAVNRISVRHLRTQGTWHEGGQFMYGDSVGAWIEGEFEGDGVRLLAFRFDDAGRVAVDIDGKRIGTIDLYGPGRGLPFDWKTTGLGPGKHVVRFTVLADKSAESKGTFFNCAGLEVIP